MNSNNNGLFKGLFTVGASIVAVGTLSWLLSILGIFSFSNLNTQWKDGYQEYEALVAGAKEVCAMEEILKTSPESDKSTRQTQRIVLKQNYARIAANYDAAAKNALGRKLLMPADLPGIAPSLKALRLKFCN